MVGKWEWESDRQAIQLPRAARASISDPRSASWHRAPADRAKARGSGTRLVASWRELSCIWMSTLSRLTRVNYRVII